MVMFFIFVGSLLANAKNLDHNSLKKECESGQGKSCGNLGAMYAQGLVGEKPDFTKAYYYYSMACEKGETDRCERAGYFAMRGKGVSQNKQAAEKLFTKGCNLDHGGCCNSLAILKMDGEADDEGVSSNIPKADKKDIWALIDKACVLEYEKACGNLVRGLKKRGVVASDKAKAVIKSFCDKGIVDACDKNQ